MYKRKNNDIAREMTFYYSARKEHSDYVPIRLTAIIEYEYDVNGLLLKSSLQVFDDDGKLSNSSKTTRRALDDGFIYERFDMEGNLEGYSRCNKDGREIESTIIGHHLTTFDKNGRVHCCKNFDEDGLLLSEYLYEYDDFGRVVRSFETENGKTYEFHHYYSRDVLDNLVETKMDEDGNLVSVRVHNKNSEQSIEEREISGHIKKDETVYFYTDDILTTGKLRYSSDKLLWDAHNHIEYDEQGNWVLQIQRYAIFDDEIRCEICQRQIQYFDHFGL